jgi:2-methylcitrate dehydratase PrpD
MTPTRDICTWVARTGFGNLPPRVVEEAKSQLLSVLAAVHAGADTDSAAAVARAVARWPATAETTSIPDGRRTSLGNALYVNAARSMALDYDDYLFAGHTGHSAVLASLAVAEQRGLGGRDVLTAQVLANEVEGRIGAAVLLGPLNGQLWTFIHLAGGAVVAGKLADLDAERLAAALGIAFLQPNYPLWAGFFGSPAKTLLAAQTVVAGVQAADLAAAGLAGAPDVLEHPQGFVRAFSREPLWGAFGGLGRAWLTDTLCYKVYPGCAYVDTVVDCVLGLVRAYRPDPVHVRRIAVGATPLTLGMEGLAAPHLRGPASTAVTLNFTVGYNAAVALIDGELTRRQFTAARIADPAVWALAARVELSLDEEMSNRMRTASLLQAGERGWALDLDAADLAGFRMSFGARVRLELDDGRVLEASEEVPLGGAGRLPSERRTAAVEKFLREATPRLGAARAREVVSMVERIECLDAAGVRGLVAGVCEAGVTMIG